MVIEKQTRKNRKENKMYNEDILATEVDENTDTTTAEEIVGEQVEQIGTPETKTYTQEQLDEIVGKRLARNTAKIRKEYERENAKYKNLENVLRAGTGKESVEEMTNTFADFYRQKGIEIPKEPTYSAKDIETLARAEASDIINGGIEEVIEETDRLADIGYDNMSPREKAVFRELAQYRKNAEESKELAKLGVTEDVYTSKEFKDFAKQFNSDTPITKIYEIFNKMQPRKEYKTAGSMKNNEVEKNKDYYTPEEIERLTDEDLDDPRVWEAVRRSMTNS